MDYHEEEIFEYLDVLRKSGQINMLHSPAYLVNEFDLDLRTARNLFHAWRIADRPNKKEP